MKKLLGIALSLTTLSTFACPDLTGNYLCNDFDTNEVQDVTITQSTNGGITTFNLEIVSSQGSESRSYVADNAEVMIDHPSFENYSERSFCEDSALKVHMKGIAKGSGDLLDATVLVKLDSNNDLYDNYIGTLGKTPISFEETCKRK